MLTRRRLWWILAALTLSILAEGSFRLLAQKRPSTGAAKWIWAPEAASGRDPGIPGTPAFVVARDFEIQGSAASARLVVLGDEEYLAYLDGEWVGANRYRLGSGADVYTLPSLSEGMHRLAIEARSTTGRGAVLAALFLENQSSPAVVSDEHWSVFDRAQAGLIEGWSQVDVRVVRGLVVIPVGRGASRDMPALGSPHAGMGGNGGGCPCVRRCACDRVLRALLACCLPDAPQVLPGHGGRR